MSSNKYFSVGVQSPTEINAPRGCAVILKRRCQLALNRITHQVSRAFDLNNGQNAIHSRVSSERSQGIMSVLTKAQMEAVYQRNCDMIYRICLMHLKHEQDALDAVSETSGLYKTESSGGKPV